MRYGHIGSFLVKWLGTVAAVLFVGLFFPLFGVMNLLQAVLLGTVITIVGYVADLFLPRMTNQIVAISSDFAMATLVVYLANFLFPGLRVTWTFAIITGFIVAGVEIFFHAKFVESTGKRETSP
ncbi:DUF2512 family protein [Effusibacillus lacus]|uniref:DUF2512 domain-containing protein n=1 Tax=Effusibacillus lacus TaxID=1348429 RepID=A0A292YL40_9BACL|nr:DUF2512 family protein [Effusibacillus lacus]TCS70660.1 uncharacterized protein DUF2512 [Effusibacillus lacus]GAX90658.1 hypothetical protein [Effusibacillus lacus]